ncbi:MAG: proton-conducting transporter membrane subunit [Planctomycetota bacterium]
MNEALRHPLWLPIAIPCAAGLVCLLLPRALERMAALLAVAAAAVTVGVGWLVFRAGPMSLHHGRWMHLRSDGLSGFVLLAITAFGFLIALYSLESMRGHPRLRGYSAALLATVGAACGAVLAGDFALLLVFWGFLGFTLYFMTGMGGEGAPAAAKKTFIIIGGSDSVMILGIALFWVLTGTTRMDGASLAIHGKASLAAFLALAAGAFAKAGAVPFHTWVPECGEKAPASVGAFLPASLDKLLGIYLLARLCGGIFAVPRAVNEGLMLLGAVSIVVAVMMALVQHDLKRLLSYHAVSQVGYMVMGIGTGTPLGMAAALFHMLNHTLYKSCLFLCAGAVEKRAGTTDLDRLGGLAVAMPLTFAACLVGALAISGIPPLNGFASKWMIYQAVIETGRQGGMLWIVWLAAAMIGSALTLASFVKVLHAVFLRKPAPDLAARRITEVPAAMGIPMAILAVCCVLFGVAAYRLPLRHIILPAVGGSVAFTGTWWAGPATLLLATAFLVGVVLYLLGTVLRARECATYIGGEDLDKAYVTGTVADGNRDVAVTGTDFYLTIQREKPFRVLYAMAERKWFDIYEIGKKTAAGFGWVLSALHTGNLHFYLDWVIVGMAALLIVLGLRR